VFIIVDAFRVHELDYQWSSTNANDAIVVLNQAMNEFDLSHIKTFKEFYDYVSGENIVNRGNGL